jgi:hypothetical protein
MKFKFTQLDHMKLGFSVNKSGQLLMVNFSRPDFRTKDPVLKFDYPHVTFVCSSLTESSKAAGAVIEFECDYCHISFDSAGKVFLKLVPGTPPGSAVLVTEDKSRDSATLGVTAVVARTRAGEETTWTVQDICNKFLTPILNSAYQKPG